MDASREEFSRFADILQDLQKDINSLTDPNKFVRKRSLEKIRNVMLANSDQHYLEKLLQTDLMNDLLQSFCDSAEICRSITVTTVSVCFSKIDNPHTLLPVIFPVLLSRFVSIEDKEQSEEIRLLLIEFLEQILDKCDEKIAPYTHDVVNILKICIVDPYPEIKKKSCTCCSKLVKTVSQAFHSEGHLLSKPLLQSMTHQHSKVRIACLKAFGDVIQFGHASWIDDGLPILAQRVCDSTASVRLATVVVIGNWLLDLPDRYSYHHKLIPLFLTAFSDESTDIKLLVKEMWTKIGMQYGNENEDDLRDLIEFSSPRKCFPEFEIERPILGCCVLVHRCFSKFLPAMLRDMEDWTIESRLRSSRLLFVVLFHLEDQVTHHIQKLLYALYKACLDEEHCISREIVKSVQLLGFYVPIDIWCNLVIPAVKASAGCSTSKTNGNAFERSSIPVGPYHCCGCLMILANLFAGYSLKQTSEDCMECLKISAECLNENEIVQTDHLPLLKQLLMCVYGIISAIPQVSLLPTNVNLELFMVIQKVSSSETSVPSLSEDIWMCLTRLAEAQKLENVSQLYSCHMKEILSIIKKKYTTWNTLSLDCGLFTNIFSEKLATSAIASVYEDVIPVFSFCTSPERSPEMQLKFITVLIHIYTHASMCRELANKLQYLFVETMQKILIPLLIWKAGRAASAIRAAALTACFHLLSQGFDCTQMSNIIHEFLPQVLSCLEDDSFSTRKIACEVMKVIISESLQSIEDDQIHELFACLTKRLDDSSDEIRLEAITCLSAYFKAVSIHSHASIQQKNIEMIYTDLVVHLDDPSPAIQVEIFSLLKNSSLHNLLLLTSVLKSAKSYHRNSKYCDELLALFQEKKTEL